MFLLCFYRLLLLEGGVCDRGDQQRGDMRGYPGEGRHRHGRRAEGDQQAPRALQDVREDLPVRL